MGRMRISGGFVGDAYMRPVRFARYIALSVWLRRAAYMPPLRTNPVFSRHHLTAGGAMPRPYGVVIILIFGYRKFSPHQSPTVTASPGGGSLFFGGAVRRERVGGASKNVS